LPAGFFLVFALAASRAGVLLAVRALDLRRSVVSERGRGSSFSDPASKGHRYAAVLNHCFAAMRLGFRERPANDAQWRVCQNPWLMLDSLQCRVSDRKLRLFAVACCRRLPHVLADEWCRSAVEVAERYAEGRAGGAELTAAQDATKDVSNRQGTDSPAACAVASDADEAARMASLFASVDSDAGREEEAAAQAALLRRILGNHFRPAPFSPMWRTDTAASLARQMYDSADFSAMPILARRHTARARRRGKPTRSPRFWSPV
jgi:hypothetical protein